MDKLIKYEFKTIVKDLLILIGVILALNLLIGFKAEEPIAKLGLSFMVYIISSVVLIIMNISQMNRDLYGDTGYLVFSIPKSGYSILGGKLINMLLQILIISLVGIIFLVFFINGQDEIFKNFLTSLNYGSITLTMLIFIFEYASLLVTIFFCITLSRVGIKNRKIGKLGAFIVFIALSFLTLKVSEGLAKIFPQSIDISMSKGIFLGNTGWINVAGQEFVKFNISTGILDVVLFIVMFIITAKLLENKIEL